MKKAMTQWSMVVALLVGSLLNAQEDGRVGINPKGEKVRATLDVQVSPDNANGTSNEGIIYPTLNKTRLANIADAKLVEGTVVFVDNVSGNVSNPKVSEVTDKGFYYYNAGDQKWKKMEGKTYTGRGGIEVQDAIIKLDAATRSNLAKINDIRSNQMVPLHKVKTDGRKIITGVDGYIRIENGKYMYRGKCNPSVIYYHSYDRGVIGVYLLPLGLLPNSLWVDDVEITGAGGPWPTLQGFLSTKQYDDAAQRIHNTDTNNKSGAQSYLERKIGEDFVVVSKNDDGSGARTYKIECTTTNLWLYEE